MAQIIICDDDLTFQLACKLVLENSGKHSTLWAKNTEEARVLLKKNKPDLLMLDIQMRSPEEGLEFLPWLKENFPQLPVLMCSGQSDFESVRRALRSGAWDYVRKDCDPDHLLHVSSKLLEQAQERQIADLAIAEIQRSARFEKILGESPATLQLLEKLEKFKKSDAPVLIWGETGTGKELAARTLRPTRANGNPAPFVSVDSATITEGTAESILFGHEKGAFTGADRSRPGLFEQANGGVIFFDELANMPVLIQQKLLRVLQEKEVTRLGSDRPKKLSFRIVCATNQDLEALVRQGKFQPDLLQRLNVLPIHLPPLRDRTGDIAILAHHFLERQKGRATPSSISPEALQLLESYPWPGNIRELQNVIDYAMTMGEGATIETGDLPERIRAQTLKDSNKTQKGSGSIYEQVLLYEKRLLQEALEIPYSSMSALAERLGMDRTHLYTKLKQHQLKH
ncbi:MAG: sigma-54-dependent transcriptional regulator [Oligoflexia bacterium]